MVGAKMTKKTVSASMFDAVHAQAELLLYIQGIAKNLAKEILGRDVIVRRNFWGAWDYRSILMTFDLDSDDKRAGFHPYGWFLYYHYRHESLVFAHKPTSNDEWQEKFSVNLPQEFYFTLDDTEKRNLLESFVRQNLLAIVEESKQY
jgi:hypothetical protein